MGFSSWRFYYFEQRDCEFCEAGRPYVDAVRDAYPDLAVYCVPANTTIHDYTPDAAPGYALFKNNELVASHDEGVLIGDDLLRWLAEGGADVAVPPKRSRKPKSGSGGTETEGIES